MIEVWQSERSATIIRLDFLFAHSDGLPCRSIGTLPGGAAMQHRAGGRDGDQHEESGRDLTTFKDKHGLRAWKGHDWDVLSRLHESGYIHDPVSKAKSVILTDQGAERSKRLFEKYFMTE